MDINQSNTLNKAEAREEKDEKHICPLQLDVIARCLELWSNKNDVVLTPFLGIGSEIYQALKMGRRGIGIELKQSYYNLAVENCEAAEEFNRSNLFSRA
jgi:DNA modification methylase